MTIKVKAMGGRTGSVDSSKEQHVLLFDAWDTDTRWPAIADLYAAVTATAPTTFSGLAPTGVTWDEDDDTGHTTFNVTYGSDEPPESLLRVGFDTTGGNVRIRTSQATTSYPVASRTAPDYKGAIEVANGEPQGIDVVIPALKLVFTYKWPKGVLSINDAKSIAGITGRTNSGLWYGFAQGELLFLGASATIDPLTPTEVQYNFAASANATLAVGTIITGIAKKGHQHLWVAFEDTEDSSAKKLIPRPLAAYVETVYLETDFTVLGIGS